MCVSQPAGRPYTWALVLPRLRRRDSEGVRAWDSFSDICLHVYRLLCKGNWQLLPISKNHSQTSPSYRFSKGLLASLFTTQLTCVWVCTRVWVSEYKIYNRNICHTLLHCSEGTCNFTLTEQCPPCYSGDYGFGEGDR